MGTTIGRRNAEYLAEPAEGPHLRKHPRVWGPRIGVSLHPQIGASLHLPVLHPPSLWEWGACSGSMRRWGRRGSWSQTEAFPAINLVKFTQSSSSPSARQTIVARPEIPGRHEYFPVALAMGMWVIRQRNDGGADWTLQLRVGRGCHPYNIRPRAPQRPFSH